MFKKVTIALRCPVCGREGVAGVRVAEYPIWDRGHRYVIVRTLPDGFEATEREGGAFDGTFDVDCSEHRVSAIIKA